MSLQSPPSDILARYRSLGQEHVFRFWAELGDADRDALSDQLRAVDIERIVRLAEGEGVVGPELVAGHRAQAPVVRLDEEPPFATRKVARAAGERLIEEGKVGVILVAGGQGSRLGFDGPKGCLPVAPLSGKTLFRLHAEKIAALSAQHGPPVPWYIMVSQANAAATRESFVRNLYFGLPPETVFFLEQAMLPAVDDEGKLVLETTARVFLSPNGHGGVFDAFRRSGALQDASRRGLEHLFYFQVDNVLIRIADPVFMGLHALGGSDYSLKLLRKTGPREKLGVVVVGEDGRHRLIEYSDLTEEEAERRGPDGELVYWAGSPAIHAFRLDFFRRVAEGSIELPYHVARKKVPTVDDAGRPTEVLGRKFESFVFDALPFASRVLNLEVLREEEFAPVKNRTGEDSLESAQALLIEEHRRWLREAGATVAGRAEVSPRVALSADDLRVRLPEEARRAWPGDVIVERGPRGSVEVREVP